MDQNLLRRRIAGVGLFIAIILLVVFGWNFINRARIDVSTNTPATISIAENGQINFTNKGEAPLSAVYSSTDPIYIRATSGDNVSQVAIEPKKRQTLGVDIVLEDLITPNQLAELSLKDMFFDGQFYYGINHSTDTITYSAITPGDFPSQLFLGIPEVTKVHWINANQFIYTRLNGGVVAYNNGQKTTYGTATDFAAHDGAYYLATPGKVSVSQDLFNSNSLTSLFDATQLVNAQIFVDDNGIYLSGPVDQNQSVQDGEPIVLDITGNQVEIYVADGTRRASFFTDVTAQVDRITSINGVLAVVGTNDVFYYDIETGEPNPLYDSIFGAQDVFVFGDQMYVLSPNGIWKFNPSTNQYTKLVNNNTGFNYTNGSFSVLNGKLHYSDTPNTITRSSAFGSNGSIYSLDL